jgi:hypothetical protein
VFGEQESVALRFGYHHREHTGKLRCARRVGPFGSVCVADAGTTLIVACAEHLLGFSAGWSRPTRCESGRAGGACDGA